MSLTLLDTRTLGLVMGKQGPTRSYMGGGDSIAAPGLSSLKRKDGPMPPTSTQMPLGSPCSPCSQRPARVVAWIPLQALYAPTPHVYVGIVSWTTSSYLAHPDIQEDHEKRAPRVIPLRLLVNP